MPADDTDLTVYPDSVSVFYEESKAARTALDAVLGQFRSNTTTVLTLATGAATFFGFQSGPKGVWYALSLGAYGVAVFFALSIYWPTGWRMNVAYDVADKLKSHGQDLPPTKMRFDLARGHQQAITENEKKIQGWHGVAARFTALAVATAAVVVLAGINVLSHQASTESTPLKVTIVKEK